MVKGEAICLHIHYALGIAEHRRLERFRPRQYVREDKVGSLDLGLIKLLLVFIRSRRQPLGGRCTFSFHGVTTRGRVVR